MPEPTTIPARRHIGGPLLASMWAFAIIQGPSLTTAAAPAIHSVTIEGMRFTPERLTVHRGERIVWVNKDLVPHTVTHAAFDSRIIAPNASWTYVAQKPGQYVYACTLHPAMKAMLIVQ